MREWLVGVMGESFASLAVVVISAGFVIVLAIVLILIARKLLGGSLAAGTRSRAPRLALVDVAAVDPKRKLVLVRRDEVEHLLLIGGDNDLVVESGILRVPAAAGSRAAEAGMRLEEERVAHQPPPRPPAEELRPVAPPVQLAAAPRPSTPVERPQPVRAEAMGSPAAAIPVVSPPQPSPRPQRRQLPPEQEAPRRVEPRGPVPEPAPVPPVAPPVRAAAAGPAVPPRRPERSAGAEPLQPTQTGRPAMAVQPMRSAEQPQRAERRPEPVRPVAAEPIAPRPMTTPTYPQRGMAEATARQPVPVEEPDAQAAVFSRRSGASAQRLPEEIAALPAAQARFAPVEARSESRPDAAAIRSVPAPEAADPTVAPAVEPDDRAERKPLSVRSFASVIQSRREAETAPPPPAQRREPELPPPVSPAVDMPPSYEDSPGLEEMLSAELASSFGEPAPHQPAPAADYPARDHNWHDTAPARPIATEDEAPPRPLTLEEEMERLLGDFSFEEPSRGTRQ